MTSSLSTVMIMILVIAAVAVIAVVIIAAQRNNRHKADRLSAAAILLREDILDGGLKRNHNAGMRFMPVLEISWNEGGRKSYVFNPAKTIFIGRDTRVNKISIRRDMVSSEHCRIDLQDGQLVLTDLNSSNGTFLKRGMKRYRVNGSVYVYSGDEIEVGGLGMKLDLFMYDTAYIS